MVVQVLARWRGDPWRRNPHTILRARTSTVKNQVGLQVITESWIDAPYLNRSERAKCLLDVGITSSK